MSGPPSELVFQELSTFVYGDAPRCCGCSRVESTVDVSIVSDVPAPTFDVSRTLDGAIVVSDAFRTVCADVPGARFVELPDVEHTSLLEVDPVVRIEPFDSRVRFGPPCETCERPRYVTRSGPIRLAPDEMLPQGFSRTDVEYGDSADFGPTRPIRFRPDILVDRATARRLKSAHLLGVHLIAHPDAR